MISFRWFAFFDERLSGCIVSNLGSISVGRGSAPWADSTSPELERGYVLKIAAEYAKGHSRFVRRGPNQETLRIGDRGA